MAFTNVNDPAGVRALLDQLRNSQAWQDVIAPPPSSESSDPVALDPPSASGVPASSSSASVASLLSQLQPNSHVDDHTTLPITASRYSSSEPIPAPPAQPAHARTQNVQSLTFQQALPHLVRLSADPHFVSKVAEMKREQDNLERQLWQERRDIQRQQEVKVNHRRRRADILSEPLTKAEADKMSESFRHELQKFDLERVLSAWDALVTKQQRALQNLEVPTMFNTTSNVDRERQRRVIQVLEGVEGVTPGTL